MKKFIFFTIISALALTTCTTDKIIPADTFIPCDPVITFSPVIGDTCFEVDEFYNGYPYKVQFPIFSYPSISPLNPNEIINFYVLPIDSMIGYNKSNFCTGEKTWVYSVGITLGPARWSKQDWIALSFNGPPYTMKSNGDSLIYLNEIAGIDNLTSAIWIEGGQKIFCFAGSPIGSNVILDKSGILLDTLPYKIKPGACLGNKIAGRRFVNNNFTICTYDYQNDSLTDITTIPYYDPSAGYSINSVDWLNEDEIIWSDSKGIQKVNIHDGNIIYLKESCDSRNYRAMCASPLHNGDIFVSRYRWNIESDTMVVRDEILKINAYTGEEWVLNLEQ